MRTSLTRALALKEGDEGYPLLDDRQILAEKTRPTIKQAKIVREGQRSRGYGFLQWTSPVRALLSLRYLTNCEPSHWKQLLPEHFGSNARSKKTSGEFSAKTPVVEFAVEKTSVIAKRAERAERTVLVKAEEKSIEPKVKKSKLSY